MQCNAMQYSSALLSPSHKPQCRGMLFVSRTCSCVWCGVVWCRLAIVALFHWRTNGTSSIYTRIYRRARLSFPPGWNLNLVLVCRRRLFVTSPFRFVSFRVGVTVNFLPVCCDALRCDVLRCDAMPYARIDSKECNSMHCTAMRF